MTRWTAHTVWRRARATASTSDFIIMSVTVICTTAIIILFASGKAYYLYYPEFILPMTAFDISADVFWLILCAMPVAAELYSRFKRRERNGAI